MILKKLSLFLMIIFVIVTTITCSNPFEEETLKEEVIVLLHEYLGESGRYVIYWDGKDKNDKYISPGKYIYLLDIKGVQDQDYLRALEGGKPGENNEGHFEPGVWTHTELQPAYPDPFKVYAGINIPFLLSVPGTVKLTIYKD